MPLPIVYEFYRTTGPGNTERSFSRFICMVFIFHVQIRMIKMSLVSIEKNPKSFMYSINVMILGRGIVTVVCNNILNEMEK